MVVGVVVSMDGKPSAGPSIDPLVSLTADGMERVNQIILARVGSDVMMIPEIAQHLINSGGKRLRPMLTLATASLSGYQSAMAM
jgi:octaprenyl-diphosphate synthase